MKEKILANIDWLIMLFLGTLVFLYTYSPLVFGKLPIQISFLSFPIFPGELALLLSLVLVTVKGISEPFRWEKKYWIFVLLYAFVFLKMVFGYLEWGALAFRNGAMFYYSLFAVIAYYAFNLEKIDQKYFRIFSFLLFTGIITIKTMRFKLSVGMDYYYIYALLAAILAMGFKSKWIRRISLIYIITVALIQPKVGARTILLAVAVSLVVVMFVYIAYFISKKNKAIFFLLLSITILVGTVYIGDKTSLKSLIYFSEYIKEYKSYIREVDQYKDYEIQPKRVQVYETAEGVAKRQEQREAFVAKEREKKEAKFAAALKESKAGEVVELEEIKGGSKTLRTAKGNTLWRMFVWRDMLKEVSDGRKVFGVDFGYPFRSRTLEILYYKKGQNWSMGHWVGWVEPHNSYIHIVYRAGLVGILFIFSVIWVIASMIRGFGKSQNLKGVLLVGGVIYWFIMASFAVILEVPYTAIPAWIFLGFVYGYYKQSKKALKHG